MIKVKGVIVWIKLNLASPLIDISWSLWLTKIWVAKHLPDSNVIIMGETSGRFEEIMPQQEQQQQQQQQR
jgi:hypothetical protein